MKALYNYRYCYLAGVCAAGGSFFGKLPSVIAAYQLLNTSSQPKDGVYNVLELLLRGLPFVAMIVCNLLNWRYFLKALQTTEQTLIATVLTAASNYMVSFILAIAFYREEVSYISACGAFLIVIGLYFLCDVDDKDVDKLKTN